MGNFVERWVEVYADSLNTTYFLHGDDPKPEILVDDIEHVYYERFGRNSDGEVMYFKRKMEPDYA